MYTTIIHPIRKAFNLSMNEYAVLDTIYHLSKNNKYGGWCIKSKQNIADDLDLSRQTIIVIIKTLEEKGLLERGESDQLRTNDEWNNIISEKSNWSIDNKEITSISFTGCKETLQGVSRNLTPTCKKILHYNNIYNNINIKKNSFEEAREVFNAIKEKKQHYVLDELFQKLGPDIVHKKIPEFYNYFTETNRNGKERWELEKTFEFKRRFYAWVNRKFTK